MIPSGEWRSITETNPAMTILWLLTVTVGPQYLLLAAFRATAAKLVQPVVSRPSALPPLCCFKRCFAGCPVIIPIAVGKSVLFASAMLVLVAIISGFRIIDRHLRFYRPQAMDGWLLSTGDCRRCLPTRLSFSC
jgi:hypothetical protein